METFSLIAVAIYCTVSIYMAIRLLALARRTREWPELLIGTAYVLGGMIGYPASVAARVLAEAGRPAAADVAHYSGQIGMAGAAFFLLLAWRRMFSSKSTASVAFVVGWTGFMVVALGWTLLNSEAGTRDFMVKPGYWALLISQAGCYATLGWATFRHSRMLRRRSALGLADPLTVNRMMLWALSNTSIACSYVYTLSLGIMLRNGLPNFYSPLVISICGLLAAAFIGLAFFPPQAWVQRVRANAATGEA